MNHYTEIIPASITPLNADQEIDITSFKKILNYFVSNNIRQVVLFGSTGEGVTISLAKKIDCIKNLLSEFHSKLSFTIGISSPGTHETLQAISALNETGIQGYLITPPFYIKPCQESIVNHFKAISGSTNKNIIAYNIPSRTNVTIQSKTFAKILLECKNVVAIKNCYAHNLYKSEVDQIIESKTRYQYLIGDDDAIITGLSMGAAGIISASACLVLKEMQNIFTLCNNSKYDLALEQLDKIAPTLSALFGESNPVGVKFACSVKNKYHKEHGPLCENNLSMPFAPISESLKNRISKLIS